MNSTREYKILDRQIIGYALPVLGQTIVAPILVTSDTVIIGHFLGTPNLAALSIGGNIALAILGLCMYVLFITNATVASCFGANKKREGLHFGVNSIYLALILGTLISLFLNAMADPIVSLFSTTPEVHGFAVSYIHGLLLGFPANLAVMAATGVLRGAKSFKIPVIASVIGAVINIPLNIVFITYFKMGIFGAGFATSCAYVVAALILLAGVLRHVFREKASLRISLSKILNNAYESVPVFIRSLLIWSSVISIVWFTTKLGEHATAGLQVLDSVFVFLEYGADAIAAALTTIVATELGAANADKAKLVVKRGIRLGKIYAAGVSIALIPMAFFIPALFTPDKDVQAYAFWGMLELAVFFWIPAYGFVIDGVLIGARDTVFLAKAVAVAIAVYMVSAFILLEFHLSGIWGFVALMITFDAILMSTRSLLVRWRISSGKWVEVGMNKAAA